MDKVEKGKLPSQTIQNPQGQNSVGVSDQSEGTFEHCKVVTTLRSGKVIDKTIQTKEPRQELQSEPVGDDEVSDKPHVSRTDVIDGEPEQDKATHTPPAPYPHKLRAPKKVNNHSEIYELFKQVKLNISLLDAKENSVIFQVSKRFVHGKKETRCPQGGIYD